MAATGGDVRLRLVASGQTSDRLLAAGLAAALAAFCLTAGQRQLWPVFVGSALLAGLLQWRLHARDGLTLAGIAVLAIGARLLLFSVPPVLSDDVYRYIWDGMLVVDGINPYAYVPSAAELAAYHDLAIFGELNSRDFYSVYPPVSQLVFAAGGLFARPDWLTGYYVIKGLITALEIAGLVVLARHLPRRQTMLLALHPVILIAGAAQGHTDGLLVLLLGSAFVAWRGGRRLLSVVLVTLAGWVKLVPLLFIPLTMRKRPLAVLAAAAVTTALVAAPFHEPYVIGHVAQSLDLYVRYFEFYTGSYYGVKQLLLELTGDDWSKQLGPAFRTAFLLVLAGLYVGHYRWRLDPWRTALWISGAYLLLTTTIHPWYFTALLILVAVNGRYSAHWQWAALWSIGTYLLYTGGPYWPFVIAGWSGFFVIAAATRLPDLTDLLLRIRAEEKYRDVRDWLSGIRPEDTVLDLGAGEGYVGRVVAERTGATVTLADVAPSSRVAGLHEIVYDGIALPSADESYDVVLLFYVLHHAAEPDAVLSEALRVTSGRVVVVESVHEGPAEKRRYEWIDRTVNRLRLGGRLADGHSIVDMKTPAEWKRMISDAGGRIVDRRERYWPWHRQAFFLIERDSSGM